MDFVNLTFQVSAEAVVIPAKDKLTAVIEDEVDE